MRKAIVSLVAVVILVLTAGPWVAGILVQENYRKLISFYNSQKTVHIEITDYHRGWMSSDIKLMVRFNKTSLQGLLKTLNIPLESLPEHYTFTLTQHLQHGPFIYSKTPHAPSIIGLAGIQSSLQPSADLRSLLLLIGSPNTKIKTMEGFVSLTGKYFSYIEASGLEAVDQSTQTRMSVNNVISSLWIQPKQQYIKGNILLTNLSIKGLDDAIEIDKLIFTFDQYKQKGLWLGANSISSPEVMLNEIGESPLIVSGISFISETSEEKEVINTKRQVDVNQVKFNEEVVGPIHLQIGLYKLNTRALQDLMKAYQETAEYGEYYQGEFRQRTTLILPKLITPGASIELHQFDVGASDGSLKLSGAVHWPEEDFVSPSNIREIIFSADAEFILRISKKLMQRVIHFAAGTPGALYDVSRPQRPLLIEARNQIDIAEKQNTLLLSSLVQDSKLTKESKDTLLKMQNELAPLDDYAEEVKNLLLSRKISAETSYQLIWQYGLLQSPYQFLLRKTDEFQESANKQLQEQFNELLSQGYVKEDADTYNITLKWSDGKMTFNNHAIK